MNFKYPSFWMSASNKRKRIYSILAVFVLAILVVIVGFIIPPSPLFVQEINDQTNQIVYQDPTARGISIFTNNFPLCLAMFVPLVGLPIGLFLMFNTGQGFRALLEVQLANGTSTTTPSPSQFSGTTAVLALIFAVLTFVFEFVSYSVAMSESIWLFRRITQGKGRHELKNLLIMIGVIAILLALGGVVETLALYLVGI